MVAVSSTATVSVVAAESEHAAALADFYRRVEWDPQATPERVARARSAAAAPPTFVCLSDRRVIGHVATVPVDLDAGGRRRTAYWLKGLMVVPEHRNGPVGMLVLKEAVRRLAAAPLMALVVEPAPRRLFAALGFADVGAIPNYVRLLQPGRVLARLDPDALPVPAARVFRRAFRAMQRVGLAGAAGGFAAGVLGLWSALAGPGRGSEHARVRRDLDTAACDALWLRTRDRLAAAPARDGSSLRARYAGDDGRPYRFVEIGDRTGLAGLAVLREPRDDPDRRLRGLRVATLSDLVYAPGHRAVGLALLAAAEREARRLHCDALLCTASHLAVRRLLRARAFLSLGGTVHFLVRDTACAAAAPLGEWWLTRGDAGADEAL